MNQLNDQIWRKSRVDLAFRGGQFDIAASEEQPTPVPSPPPAGCGGTVRLGTPVAGMLTSPTQQCVYTYNGSAGENVKITLVKTSGSLDSYLELYGSDYPDGSRLDYNDDNPLAGGRNSQINRYRLGKTDAYKIVVSSYAGESTGAYRLTVARP